MSSFYYFQAIYFLLLQTIVFHILLHYYLPLKFVIISALYYLKDVQHKLLSFLHCDPVSLENIMRTIIHIFLTHCRERRLRSTRYFILYEYDRDVMWCNKACWIDCFSLYCPLSDNVPHRVEMYLKLYCTNLTVPSCTVPFNRVRTFVYCTWAKFALRY